MEELLIELVRKYPAIYDKSHKDYKDRSGVVQNIWEAIEVQLKANGFELGGEFLIIIGIMVAQQVK